MYAPLADAGGVLPPELLEVAELPFPLLDEIKPEPELEELAELLVELMPLGPLDAPELDVLELVLLERLAIEPLEPSPDKELVPTLEALASSP
jgi:hypothetical protein